MLNFSDKTGKCFTILFFIFFTVSCSKQAPVPMKKMSEILLRMHLAEAYTQVTPRVENGVSIKQEDSLLKFNAMILKEFNITKKEFNYSLDYYKQEPVLLDSIYQVVLSEIAILQAKNKKKP